MSLPEPVISLRGVSRYFLAGDIETHALDGIDLDVHCGEFLAVVGPSGSGKSTLLSIMGLLDRPSRGSLRFEDVETAALSAAQLARMRNSRIGFVFQSFNLIGDLTVLENVALPLSYRRGVSRGERAGRARRALEVVEMDHRINHYPSEISGGQQQRVAIARALVGEPAIIFADEPTGNLDSQSAARIMDVLGTLNRAGTTVCMITHDEHFAAQASRIITIADGRLQAAMGRHMDIPRNANNA